MNEDEAGGEDEKISPIYWTDKKGGVICWLVVCMAAACGQSGAAQRRIVGIVS